MLTRDHESHLRLAVKALLDVGNALTYTEAAARARSTAGRGLHGGIQPNGSLVAEWIAVFAPLLVREHAETCWPETVLVDSTNFIISSTRMGTSKQAFAIAAVYGCAKDSERGKLLGLYATHEHFAGSHGEAFAYFEALGNERSGATGMWTPPTIWRKGDPEATRVALLKDTTLQASFLQEFELTRILLENGPQRAATLPPELVAPGGGLISAGAIAKDAHLIEAFQTWIDHQDVDGVEGTTDKIIENAQVSFDGGFQESQRYFGEL